MSSHQKCFMMIGLSKLFSVQNSYSNDDDVKKNKCPAVPIKQPKRKVVHAVAGSDARK